MMKAAAPCSRSLLILPASGGRSVAAVSGRCAVARSVRPRGAAVKVFASSTPPEKGSSSADEFLSSPVGKFVSWLGNTITSSSLNDGKIMLAKFQAGDYDEAAVSAQVEDMIANEKVIMFSFSTCPFCVKAKDLLESLGVEYKALEVNEMGKEGYAIRAELAKRTGRTSMPNIFIGGEGIGGCNDGPGIMTLQREGLLVPKLQEAGVTL